MHTPAPAPAQGSLEHYGLDVSQATVAKYLVRGTKPAVADIANLPRESPPANRGCRFLRRANCHLPALIRARDPRARAPTRRARRGHGPSHRRMDGPTTSGSLSVRRHPAFICSTIAIRRSTPGRRRRPRWASRKSSRRFGHPGRTRMPSG